MEEVKRIEELEVKNEVAGIWEEVEVEIDKLFEQRRFRSKNWNAQKIREALEALEPGKVYKISVQKFVETFGLDGVKKLTLQGQKKKIRQVLRRMGDYFELKVSFDGNIIHIMRVK